MMADAKQIPHIKDIAKVRAELGKLRDILEKQRAKNYKLKNERMTLKMECDSRNKILAETVHSLKYNRQIQKDFKTKLENVLDQQMKANLAFARVNHTIDTCEKSNNSTYNIEVLPGMPSDVPVDQERLEQMQIDVSKLEEKIKENNLTAATLLQTELAVINL